MEQPVAFFGSEGAVGIVARHFADYLWLLAAGFGPLEAIDDPHGERTPISHFLRFAQKHASAERKSAAEVIAAAALEFPNFVEHVRASCR